eukprot:m.65225 g.65225  ORF g.65225 m.65225 type:complete len:283 (-) comp11719_c0_seq4:19-867(-)
MTLRKMRSKMHNLDDDSGDKLVTRIVTGCGVTIVLVLLYLLCRVTIVMLSKPSSHSDEYPLPAMDSNQGVSAELQALAEELDILHGKADSLLEQEKIYYEKRNALVKTALGQGDKPRFRSDGRCGPNYGAPGSPDFGECDPNSDADQKGPCCRVDSGWCGNERGKSWGHCPLREGEQLEEGDPGPACPDSVCIDYSEVQKHRHLAVSKLVEGAKRFRSDGRCGPNFPAPGAPEFGECDPLADADQKGPCCRVDSGWCGNVRGESWGHCPPDCQNCIDYSKQP